MYKQLIHLYFNTLHLCGVLFVYWSEYCVKEKRKKIKLRVSVNDERL